MAILDSGAYNFDLTGYPMAQQVAQAAAVQRAQQDQQQQQDNTQNADPLQMLQNAKRGYDISQKGKGGSGVTPWAAPGGDLMAVPGAGKGAGTIGWGSPAGGAAFDAGVQAVPGGLSNAAVTGGGASGASGAGKGSSLMGKGAGGSSGKGGMSGFMAGPYAGLGGLAGLGLAAYLGYQHGEAQGKKYRAAEQTPEFQASKSFVDQNPGAITTEGVDPSVQLPDTIPMAGWGQGTTWNPVKRRYEINGMSFPEWQAYQDLKNQNESPD